MKAYTFFAVLLACSPFALAKRIRHVPDNDEVTRVKLTCLANIQREALRLPLLQSSSSQQRELTHEIRTFYRTNTRWGFENSVAPEMAIESVAHAADAPDEASGSGFPSWNSTNSTWGHPSGSTNSTWGHPSGSTNTTTWGHPSGGSNHTVRHFSDSRSPQIDYEYLDLTTAHQLGHKVLTKKVLLQPGYFILSSGSWAIKHGHHGFLLSLRYNTRPSHTRPSHSDHHVLSTSYCKKFLKAHKCKQIHKSVWGC